MGNEGDFFGRALSVLERINLSIRPKPKKCGSSQSGSPTDSRKDSGRNEDPSTLEDISMDTWLTRKVSISIICTLITLLLTATVAQGIDVLQFRQGEKAWQITAQVSRYINTIPYYSIDDSGLWHNVDKTVGLVFSFASFLDITSKLAVQGQFSLHSASVWTRRLNLYYGTEQTIMTRTKELGQTSLKIRYVFYQTTDIKAHLLIPLIGHTIGIGFSWTSDPVMVLPEIRISPTGIELLSGLAFVANTKLALTARMHLVEQAASSKIALSIGLVYRKTDYEGVQVVATIARGDSTQVNIQLGVCYGREQ